MRRSGEQIDILIKRLEVGLPVEALELLDLPISLERGEYLALYQRGIKTPTEVWQLDQE
jgi:helicase